MQEQGRPDIRQSSETRGEGEGEDHVASTAKREAEDMSFICGFELSVRSESRT